MCRPIAAGGRRCPSSSPEQRALKTSTQKLKEDTRTPSAPMKEATSDTATLTPYLHSIVNADIDEWFATPWKDRKETIEIATRELILLTGSEANWDGWNRKPRALGTATSLRSYMSDHVRRGIEFSEPLMRFVEPREVADTLAHEVAHTLVPTWVGHGREWAEEFNKLKGTIGVDTSFSKVHNNSEREKQERLKAAAWLGSCPQGHIFPAGRKPTNSYTCTACKRADLPNDITYERNPNRGGKK